jgi:Ser/Thr protein kinase RdoA (MazF antagonist)
VAEVEYEVRLLQHLAKIGWPVPAPIGGPVEVASRIWALFPYLPGRSPAPRSHASVLAEQRRRGRLLARLHADMAPLAALGQRHGWRRTDEGLFDRPGRRPTRDILRDHEERDPEASRLLLEYNERARARLDALLPSAPAPITIHGDVAPWNMRYTNGQLTGLFDFDVAHLDLRVADFALSWRGKHDGVLEGYEEESPLEEVEHELLVPVYWAWMIACAVSDIEDGNGRPDWALTHLVRQSADRWSRTA